MLLNRFFFNIFYRWCIVRFEANEYELVTSKWVVTRDSKDYCFWPKPAFEGKASKWNQKEKAVDKNIFVKYPVQLKYQTDNYEKGMEKLNTIIATNNSDVNSDSNNNNKDSRAMRKKITVKYIPSKATKEDGEYTEEEDDDPTEEVPAPIILQKSRETQKESEPER